MQHREPRLSHVVEFLLMASLALASPTPQIRPRDIPDGVVQCIGSSAASEPFDLVPQAKASDCQALLTQLMSSRDTDVQTGGGGELLTETENDSGAGTKVVNFDSSLAFGTQMSASAAGSSTSCVLEIIAQNTTDPNDPNTEQITLFISEAIELVQASLTCADSNGNLAGMSTVHRIDAATGNVSEEFMVYISGQVLLSDGGSSLDPSLQAALPFGVPSASDKKRSFPPFSHISSRQSGQCPPTAGIQRASAGSLVINFIQGAPAISSAVAQLVTADFIGGPVNALIGQFRALAGQPTMINALGSPSPGRGFQPGDIIWTTALQLAQDHLQNNIVNWNDVAKLAGGVSSFTGMLNDVLPTVAGLQTAFFEIVDTTGNNVVAVLQVLVTGG